MSNSKVDRDSVSAPRLTPEQANSGMTQEMLDRAFQMALQLVGDRLDLLQFISYIPKRQQVNGRWRVVDVQAYMQVDGRLQILGGIGRKGHEVGLQTFLNAEDITLKIPWYNATGERTGVVVVPPMSCVAVVYSLENPDRQILRTGTAKIGGDKGAAKSCPYEDAETSAVGRVLGFAGIGLLGSGIASAEEVERALGDKSRSSSNPAKRNNHFSDIGGLRAWAASEMERLSKVPDGAPADERLYNNLVNALQQAGLGECYLPDVVKAIWPDSDGTVTSRKAMVIMNLTAHRLFEADILQRAITDVAVKREE